MSRTVMAALAVAGALMLSGFSCGGTPEPASPFTCQASFGGAVSEVLWCIPGSFDYTTLPDGGIQSWALDVPLYRGSPFLPTLPEVGGGVGFFAPGPPVPGVSYGWNGVAAPNVDAGGAQRVVGFVPPSFAGVMTHEMVVPLSWPDLGTGRGTLSVTFSAVPAPGDFLGGHAVIDATLPATADGGYTQPVTLRVVF